MGFSLCGLDPQEREQPAAKDRSKPQIIANESNTAREQSANHITKTHNNISCLRKRITKRTAPTFNSQTSPPKQVACGIEPQRSERKRGKRIFSFCSATATTKTSINNKTQQSIPLSSANNSLFFSRAGLQSLSAHSSQHRAPKEKNVLLWIRTTNSTTTKRQRREPSDSR